MYTMYLVDVQYTKKKNKRIGLPTRYDFFLDVHTIFFKCSKQRTATFSSLESSLLFGDRIICILKVPSSRKKILVERSQDPAFIRPWMTAKVLKFLINFLSKAANINLVS